LLSIRVVFRFDLGTRQLTQNSDPACSANQTSETFALEQPSPYLSARQLLDVKQFQKRVVYEDNHLLVVDKPVCIATQGASANQLSLFNLAQHYVKIKYNKPGAVFLGVVSRIDYPVSGVVVFARTSKSAKRLNEQFRGHSVHKVYRALLEGTLKKDSAELVNYICEDEQNGRLWISETPNQNKRFKPKESRLVYKTISRFPSATLVEIELLTGRKHQIRLQFAHQSAPVVGDGKYGAQILDQRGICLHSYKLTLSHPTQSRRLTFIAPQPVWI